MSLKTAIIHQPHFLPWLGYFNKLANSDIFIIQDNVQFRRRYFQNRTKIQNSQKHPIWFTIPVHAKRHTKIMDVKTVDDKWKNDLFKKLLHSYNQENFYDENIDFIKESILNTHSNYLTEINQTLINDLGKYLNIQIEFEFAHHYEKYVNPSYDLVNICLKNNVKRYLFGEGGGIKYHGTSYFKKNNIVTTQQKFQQKFNKINNSIYSKSDEMSIIHYLFTIGRNETEKIIKETWKIKTAYNRTYNSKPL